MLSNSKLTEYEKAERKRLKAELLAAGGVLVLAGAVTVALQRTGRTSGCFAVSIASPDEKKIRQKVGEYHALARMEYDGVMPVRLCKAEEAVGYYATEAEYLEMVAENIAYALQP